MSGYIYIFANPSLSGIVKIGKTRRNPFARAEELHTTGIPTPFHVCFVLYVAEPDKLERQIHSALKDVRVEENREFFRIGVKEAAGHIISLASEPILHVSDKSEATSKSMEKEYAEALERFAAGDNFNPSQGIKIMEKLAKLDVPDANLFLGMNLCNYKGDSASMRRREREYLECAVTLGEREAMFRLAQITRSPESISYYDLYLRTAKEENVVESVMRLLDVIYSSRYVSSFESVEIGEDFALFDFKYEAILTELLESRWNRFLQIFEIEGSKIVEEAIARRWRREKLIILRGKRPDYPTNEYERLELNSLREKFYADNMEVGAFNAYLEISSGSFGSRPGLDGFDDLKNSLKEFIQIARIIDRSKRMRQKLFTPKIEGYFKVLSR